MFRNESDFKNIVNRLNIDNKPNNVHRENLRRQMLSVFNEIRQKAPSHAATWQIIWRTIMKSPITKLAAAAVVIIAVLIGIHHFGGSIDGASVVFADVLEQIYKARTVTYKQTIIRGEESYPSQKMIMEPGYIRTGFSGSNISITDFSQGRTLELWPEQKTAVIRQSVGRPRRQRLLNRLEWVSKLHEKSGEFIGQEEIDGQIADVFVIKEDFEETTVWTNPETNLPIRVERVFTSNLDNDIIVPRMLLSEWDFIEEDVRTEDTIVTTVVIKCSDKYKGIQDKMMIIMSNFDWDTDLDESLFSLDVPEGYTVEKMYHDASNEDERHLIDSLAFWTEMSEGVFPSSINDLGDPNKVRPMLIRKFDRDGDSKEEFERAVQVMQKMLNGLMFAQKLKVDGSWHYAGDSARLGDVGKPICWWKPEDSEFYRVIYGDLSVGDSTEIPEPQEDKPR